MFTWTGDLNLREIMSKKPIYFIAVAGAVMISSMAYLANRYFIAKEPIELISIRLNDADWQRRDSAIVDLLSHKEFLQDKNIADQVIELFNREVSDNRKLEGDEVAIEIHEKKYGEGYGEYFLDVLDLVRSIDDKRIIPGLADSVASGRVVWETLARFGNDAVDPLIYVFKSTGDISKRGDSVDALSVLRRQKISNESKNKIQQVFLDALKDEHWYVRNAGQRALEKDPSLHN